MPGPKVDPLLGHSFSDHKADRDEVGGEVTRDDEGDDGVEGDGGADVDQAEEGVDRAGEGDGVERDCPASVDLQIDVIGNLRSGRETWTDVPA